MEAILGAAVIDDIMGIVVLTFVISMKDTSVSIISVLVKILLYTVLMLALGYVCTKFKGTIDANLGKRRITTYVVAACFIIAFISETYFGVADITGAYLLGLFLSQHDIKAEVAKKISSPSYLFFSPIFFASVGLKVELSGLTGKLLVFSVIHFSCRDPDKDHRMRTGCETLRIYRQRGDSGRCRHDFQRRGCTDRCTERKCFGAD